MLTFQKILRVRESIVDTIDQCMMPEFYTTRPEWILQSMRRLYGFTLHVLDDASKSSTPSKDLADFFYSMSVNLVRFNSAEGEGTPITLRIPAEFRDSVERFCGRTMIFPTFTDFIKCSVIYGIEHREPLTVPTDEMLSEVERVLSQKTAIRKGA